VQSKKVGAAVSVPFTVSLANAVGTALQKVLSLLTPSNSSPFIIIVFIINMIIFLFQVNQY
jgi:hypothetical protein